MANKANEMRKDGLLRSVWTIDGKIFATTSPGGKPQQIYCEQDLGNLCNGLTLKCLPGDPIIDLKNVSIMQGVLCLKCSFSSRSC